MVLLGQRVQGGLGAGARLALRVEFGSHGGTMVGHGKTVKILDPGLELASN